MATKNVGYLNRAQRRGAGVMQKIGQDEKAIILLQSELQKMAVKGFLGGTVFGIVIGAILLTVVLKVLV